MMSCCETRPALTSLSRVRATRYSPSINNAFLGGAVAATDDILVFGAHRSGHWQGVAVVKNRHWEHAAGDTMFSTLARIGCLQDDVNGVPVVIRAGTYAMSPGLTIASSTCTLKAHPVRRLRRVTLRAGGVLFLLCS